MNLLMPVRGRFWHFAKRLGFLSCLALTLGSLAGSLASYRKYSGLACYHRDTKETPESCVCQSFP